MSAVLPPTSHRPITVALVDDYDVVQFGVAQMLDPYRYRVRIAELDTNEPVHDTVDIACTTPSPNPNPITKK